MKIISIIIATYNSEVTLERCLKSIISQKKESIELIIVDGASKDGTLEIIDKYQNSIEHVISEPDNGLYEAWNKGLGLASGQWIQFIGSDDVLLPGAIDGFLSFLKDNEVSNIDYVSAKGELVDVRGQFLQYYGDAYSWKTFKNYMNVSHGASLHNRALFNDVGLYNTTYKICADYELLLRKKDYLKTLFFDKIIIRMQVGGMSYSIQGLKESYKIKKIHKTSSTLSNLFYYYKGVISLKIKKIFWKID